MKVLGELHHLEGALWNGTSGGIGELDGTSRDIGELNGISGGIGELNGDQRRHR